MAKREYSEVEMIGTLKEVEAGCGAEVERELGVSKDTICAWKPSTAGWARLFRYGLCLFGFGAAHPS